MTVTSKCLVQGKRVEDSTTIQYTSTSVKTILDGVVVSNPEATPATLTAWLVPSGGTATNANQFVNAKPIAAGDTYLCPELVGRRMDAGDTLHMKASIATTLSVRVDGRVVTA